MTLDTDRNHVVEESDFLAPLDEADNTQSSSGPEIIPISYKKKAVDFWRNAGGKPRSYKVVRHRFQKLTSRSQLNLWESQVQKMGTKTEKLQYIARETFEKFKTARDNNKTIHDANIRKWALKFARQVHDDTFRASSFWLRNFKIKYNIVSRKITKFVTKRYCKESADRAVTTTLFVGDVSALIETHGPEKVFNTDQSGFNLEFHAGRTLHEKGEKTVLAETQNLNALTHSYTIQPIISCDGQLLPKLLVVLKENDGSC